MKKLLLILPAVTVAFEASAQETDSIKSDNLDELIIEAYIQKSVNSSNKMPLKDIENPQVYNVINKNILKEQLVTTFSDAMKNATGVSRLWESTGRGSDGAEFYSMRGFSTQPRLLNGMPSFSNGSLDPANIESIEVIKGPSGTMYGGNLVSYGGLINITTKKPYETFGGEMGYTNGSYGLNRVTADINTPLNKQTSFRLNTAYQYRNSFQDAGFSKSLFFAPSLKFVANDRLTFFVNTEFKSSEAANAPMIFLSRYSPLSFQSMDLFEQNYKKSYTSNDLTIKNPTFNLQAYAVYQLSENWTSTTILSKTNAKTSGYYHYLWDSANGDEFTRFITKGEAETNATGIQQNFVGTYNIGSVKNKLVAGLDYFQRKFTVGGTGWASYGTVSLVNQTDTMPDANNEMQQTMLTTPHVDAALLGTSAELQSAETKIYSAYTSNVIEFLPNLSAMISLRADHFTGQPTAYSTDKLKERTTFSPKFGVVYQPILNKLSVFGNYMNGFQYLDAAAIDVTDEDGNIVGRELRYFEPEQANQWEVGTKASLIKDRLSVTASYYDIKVKNKVMGNGIDATQAGEVESKGFEVSVLGSPINGLNIIAGYSHNNNKVINDAADSGYLGLRTEEAGPENLINFWANYTVQQGTLKNFGLGFGANSASELLTLNRSTIGIFALPGYTVFNAALSYNAEKYSAVLKVDNLTNEKYFIGWSTINPQFARSISLGLNYKF
ncbi:iron complex outermembrane recepter protein [Paenimyroides ummariense]|uniref:Iron complex outermembrane recepter protein n=1 Tax=Paenimyroides ummariense TaxID=913024 RepID=A0A1I5BLL4_9FLAO|nr:TonB-dependent receptor plug domain-containing protein [Paenimyroides ummariense]SFN75489.1 iron complex outermembrane recepter protein [Paenimyroides ummariense]